MKQFSSVAAMTAAFLQAGTNQIVETKGYYTEGDGGAGRYLIMSLAEYGGTPDEQGVAFTCASGNVAVLQVGECVTLSSWGIRPTDAVGNRTAWTRAVELAHDTGKQLVVDTPDNWLISDYIYIHRSGVTVNWVGAGFAKLANSSSIGVGLVVYDPTQISIVENVTIYDPKVDCDDFGWPKGSTYGENGIGGTNCRHVKVFGGHIKNARRGASNPIGTGGKAVQFENGVYDIEVIGLTAENCTIAVETGGVADSVYPPTTPAEFSSAALVTYRDIKAINCERVISLQQSSSPPNTSTKVLTALIDGVTAHNCGREAAGDALGYGAIVVDRASNCIVRGVLIANDTEYGAIQTVVRLYSGEKNQIEVTFHGECVNHVLNQAAAGFGTTGNNKENKITITHFGDVTGEMLGSPLAVGSRVVGNEYILTTNDTTAITTLTGNYASATCYAVLTNLATQKRCSGLLSQIYEFNGSGFGNSHHTVCGISAFNKITFTYGGAGQIISASENLNLAVNSVPKLAAKSTGAWASLPTSATGLVSGDLWNDGGTVKIV